jgi:hypothetical protein
MSILPPQRRRDPRGQRAPRVRRRARARVPREPRARAAVQQRADDPAAPRPGARRGGGPRAAPLRERAWLRGAPARRACRRGLAERARAELPEQGLAARASGRARTEPAAAAAPQTLSARALLLDPWSPSSAPLLHVSCPSFSGPLLHVSCPSRENAAAEFLPPQPSRGLGSLRALAGRTRTSRPRASRMRSSSRSRNASMSAQQAQPASCSAPASCDGSGGPDPPRWPGWVKGIS